MRKFFFTAAMLASMATMAQFNGGQRRGGGPGGPGGAPPQMNEETKAIFDSCKSSSNMPERDSGTRPTEAQRAAFETCLKKNNVEMPPRHEGGKGHGQRQQPPPPPPESENDSEGTGN